MDRGFSIRRYRQSDQDRVVELHERAMRDVGTFVEDVSAPDLHNIEETYLAANGEFLVGEVDGEVVAMGALRQATGYITECLTDITEDSGEIKRLRVAPSHQGNGYGTQIFAELERRAGERGYTELVLDTDPRQNVAKHLYETNGFEQDGRQQLEVAGEPFELVFYRKKLKD